MPSNLFQLSGISSGLDTNGILDALRLYRMRPVTLVARKQEAYAAKKSAWQDINARLLSVKSAADTLNQTSAFSTVKATAADITVAGVSADASAAPGNVNLNVTSLAQARKIVSNIQADSATALGFTGDFTIGGKRVDVEATDTLSRLSEKINALNLGVSASVIQVATGQHRLTLSGLTSGLQDSLSVAEVGGGNTLRTLGLINAGAAGVRHTSPDGNSAQSIGFSSATTKLDEVLGLGGTLAGSFTVNGAAVSYDTNVDTLTTLATKISALGVPGLSAQAVSVTDSNGKATQRLKITGTTLPTFGADANNLLGMVGVTQVGTDAANVLASAQDSQFSLDGLAIRRASNTVTDALSGVTLNLLKAGSSTTLTLTRDTAATTDAVGKYVSAYNSTISAIKKQFTFAAGTEASQAPALLGDAALRQIQSDLVGSVTAVVDGQPTGFKTLQDIGVTLKEDNTLAIDSGKLNAKLAENRDAVAKLFTMAGATTDPDVTFLSAGAKTQSTTGVGYAVVVTAAATRAQVMAGIAADATLSTTEDLTFSGALFPTSKTVTLASGNTLAQTINQINNSEAGALIEAFEGTGAEAGKLGLRSRAYGASQGFSVLSNRAPIPADPGIPPLVPATPAQNFSGIGTTVRSGTGADVAGTINGETAAGFGQVLTGSQANGRANELALKVTATVSGPQGNVTVQRGVAATLTRLTSQLTDSSNGSVKLQQDTLQSQIDDATRTMLDLTKRVESYIGTLQMRFTRMEGQVAKYKSQSSQFAQQVAGLSNLYGNK